MLKRLSQGFGSQSTPDLPATIRSHQSPLNAYNTDSLRHSIDAANPSASLRVPAGSGGASNMDLNNSSINMSYETASESFSSESYSSSSFPAAVLPSSALHKSLRAFESVLTALHEHRQTTDALAKSGKKLSKATKGLSSALAETSASSSKAEQERDPLLNGLASAAAVIDSAAAADTKYAKLVSKSYDGTNSACDKVFKKVAKEERSHNDSVANMDNKFRQASNSYEKSVRSGGSSSAPWVSDHQKMLNQLSALSYEIKAAKDSHGHRMRQRKDDLALSVARSITTLADDHWKTTCEAMRLMGADVGRVETWMALLQAQADKVPSMPAPSDASSSPASAPSSPSVQQQPSPQQHHLQALEQLQGRSQPPSPSSPQVVSRTFVPQSSAMHFDGYADPYGTHERARVALSPHLRRCSDQPSSGQVLSNQTQTPAAPVRPLLSQSQPNRNSMPVVPTHRFNQSEDLDRTIRSPRRKLHDQPTAAEIASAWQQSNRQTPGSSNSSASTSDLSASNESQESTSRSRPPIPSAPNTPKGGKGGLEPAAQLGHVPVHTGFAVEQETQSPVEETPRILTKRRSNSMLSMDSLDSTESSDTKRSFVARMKQRYQDESARSSYFDGTKAVPPPRGTPSRVADTALRFEDTPHPRRGYKNPLPSLPTHSYSMNDIEAASSGLQQVMNRRSSDAKSSLSFSSQDDSFR